LEHFVELLIVEGIDITHIRLVDLTRLADQAKSFYDWVEVQFQATLVKSASLDDLLKICSQEELEAAINVCYRASGTPDLPFLFDGIGRTYPHIKACYYFFSWLIRDAPQQRLSPLIQRIVRSSGKSRIEIEIQVLAALIHKYRVYVKTFAWEAIREVIIDRLEGSRRSIKGHEKEAVVRTALLIAIQKYFTRFENYGIYSGVVIADGQVMIGNESYDVSVGLLDMQMQGQVIRRILVPIKTRETEGGGHSHLFSRDILSAINAVRYDNANDYLVVIIVAKNWSRREADTLREIVDHLVVFDLAPGEFNVFSNVEQAHLNSFVASVLDGSVLPTKLVIR
jgi:hypothetical protein